LPLIDPALQTRQQLGRAPNFVEHGAVLEARQEAPRIGQRERARVRVFERHVGVTGKGGARQRGLARPARTRGATREPQGVIKA
jgi:hypothetical protein